MTHYEDKHWKLCKVANDEYDWIGYFFITTYLLLLLAYLLLLIYYYFIVTSLLLTYQLI